LEEVLAQIDLEVLNTSQVDRAHYQTIPVVLILVEVRTPDHHVGILSILKHR